MMHRPPFRLASSVIAASVRHGAAAALKTAGCCETPEVAALSTAPARLLLAKMDPHLHCSIIGTCLGTDALRKLMTRFIDTQGASDLDVHHEAVRLAAEGGAVAKALHKSLDQQHDAAIQRLARIRDAQALADQWADALGRGDIPGTYWAVLSHRYVTPELRQRVFGDVHMLSHRVGASNRADLRRLAALEQENVDLRERLERQHGRSQELLDERDRAIAELQRDLARAEQARTAAARAGDHIAARDASPADATTALVALQTERRERAEQTAAVASAEATRLRDELAHLSRHAQSLGRELAVAEWHLREASGGSDTADAGIGPRLAERLRGRRILYVGGRPSSSGAIRDLVVRQGGEFQRHDGGFEDRKGLLAAGVAWADLVAFPVDCIDHDSAGNLKRLCARQGTAWVPLRSASVTSFAAALATPPDTDPDTSPTCLRHA